MTSALSGPLSAYGLTIPVIAAPMSGGPSTPAMVLAASRAGALGFLAAGYKTPDALGSEISAVRSASIPFGVNVFAPNAVPVEPDAYREYAEIVQREADRFGLTLPRHPVEDDDHFGAKVDMLVSDPVPVVTRAFTSPPARGLRNTFIDSYERRAPLGYPAIHHDQSAAQSRGRRGRTRPGSPMGRDRLSPRHPRIDQRHPHAPGEEPPTLRKAQILRAAHSLKAFEHFRL